MKEMIILPGGRTIYRIVTEYHLDTVSGKYRAEIEHDGVKYIVHFYGNFWA